MISRKPILFFIALVLLWLGPGDSVRAALLAYEGFNYPPGDTLTNSSAQGSGDSFGWGGRWGGSPGGLATNVAATLTYVDALGNALSTDSGSVIIGVPGGTTANAQPSRSFNFGTLSGATYGGLIGVGTHWVSFLMKWVGPVTPGSATNQYVRKGDFVFRSGIATNTPSGGTALYTVGSPNALNRLGTPYDTWATWTGNDAGNGVQNTGLAASTIPLNALTFVLMRIDTDGTVANDTVYTWFNWTNLASEPPISTAALTTTAANEDGLNNLRLDANGGNAAGTNTVLAFDEFRLGDTFADVTPYASGEVLPPTITAQPMDTSVTYSYPASFSLSAIGPAPLAYQWYFNGTNVLNNQTNTSLAIASAQTNDAGGYSCVVANAGGSVTSSVANLTILGPIVPSITTQPLSDTNAIGYSVSFAVGASGSAPLVYQWYFNGATPLTSQTNTTLSFVIASTNDAGAYSVIVTNKFGSATSAPASLAVAPFSIHQLPAFPGADGAGKRTSGGRGGTIYHVTKLDKNLNDLSPGTLRYGLSQISGPKTIVFDVAGVFWLGLYGAESNYDNGWDTTSRYSISDNTTIAGQTAPGPVIIMGGLVKESGNNVILRNITCAAGYGMRGFHVPPTPPTPGTFPDSFLYDCIDITGHDLIIDHVTAMYNTDESISCNEMTYNCTVENCVVAQGEDYPQRDAENPGTWEGHALAQLWEGAPGGTTTVANNLFAHMSGRLPALGGGAINDFRNNVIYNWLGTAGYESRAYSFNNFINNFYLAGPGGYDNDTLMSSNIVFKSGGTGIFYGYSLSAYIYPSGNLMDLDKNGSPNNTVSADNSYLASFIQTTAYDVNIGMTLTAKNAFTNDLSYAGSRWWERPYNFQTGNVAAITTNDMNAYENERIVHETITGTGNIIAFADDPFNNDPSEGVEWRELLALRADPVTGVAPYNRPADWDTDGDGMPDYWEIKHGLNPNDPSDANGDFDQEGYSNLEEYLNEIAAWPAPVPVLFSGDQNNRYASVFNWRISGEQVNISGPGNVTTFSYWQPSRYDTAIISNTAVVVDAVGQHAGTLVLTNLAVLNITNGWLETSNLNIGAGCTVAVQPAGLLRLAGSGAITLASGGTFTNAGTLDLISWTGTLPAGFVNLGTILDRSLVRMDSATSSGFEILVKIQGYRGHNYQLQYLDHLSSATWQNAGEFVAGANALITFHQPNDPTTGQRYYRVAVD